MYFPGSNSDLLLLLACLLQLYYHIGPGSKLIAGVIGIALSIFCSFKIDSLWPSDTTWQRISGSTVAQVKAGCLMATSHYLNKCWLLNSEVLWHSLESNSTVSAQDTLPYDGFKILLFKILPGHKEITWHGVYHTVVNPYPIALPYGHGMGIGNIGICLSIVHE